VHRDGDFVDLVVPQRIRGDDLGQPLDEVVGVALDAGQRCRTDLAVVDRVGEVVGGARWREVEGQLDVDDELLPLAALVLEDAVEAAAAHAREPDAVGPGAVHRSSSDPRSASVTSRASTVATTSCTRTHHTP